MTAVFTVFSVHVNGRGTPLLNPIVFEGPGKGEYISCGGVFDSSNTALYSTECQEFQQGTWLPHNNMALAEPRNASAFAFFHPSKKSGWITGGFMYDLEDSGLTLKPLK